MPPQLIEIIKDLESEEKQQRKKSVLTWLDLLNIHYEIQKYSTGENIISTIGNRPYVGVGSHYDVVLNCPGANDNASAIAVTINILRKASQDSLENIGVRGFFFDEEETGLKGSRAYVQQNGIREIIGVYNMELVGSGDKVALWPVKYLKNTTLLKALEKTAKTQGIKTYRFPKIITNTADHASFNKAGLKDAFTLTTITNEDLAMAPKYLLAMLKKSSGEKMNKIISQAPVFKHYHQPTDISEHLSDDTLQMVSNLLWESIKEVDKTYKK